MNLALQRLVRERAGHRCEYCKLPEALSELHFVIDHIIARQHRGLTVGENLALCCGICNRHKGPNLSGIDQETKALTPLFHPRQDIWLEHFAWRGESITGLTPIGRVTIHVLAMNHVEQLAIRRALSAEGQFPKPQSY